MFSVWDFDMFYYRQTSNISTLEGHEIVDPLDVVGASSVGAAFNYVFILELTTDLNGLGKDNCKARRGTFKFWNLVCLILEVWRYTRFIYSTSRRGSKMKTPYHAVVENDRHLEF